MLKILLKLRKKGKPLPHEIAGAVYDPYRPHKPELRDVERSFVRLFSSDDGRAVLAHLQQLTFQRALGADSSAEQLRYLEGQRSIVATILRLIERGKNS